MNCQPGLFEFGSSFGQNYVVWHLGFGLMRKVDKVEKVHVAYKVYKAYKVMRLMRFMRFVVCGAYGFIGFKVVSPPP